jgi:hypothetical protein
MPIGLGGSINCESLTHWLKLSLTTFVILSLVLTGPVSAISVPLDTSTVQDVDEQVSEPSHNCGVLHSTNESQKRCLMNAYAPVLHFPLKEDYRPTSVSEFIEVADVDEGPTHLQEPASIGTLGDREPDSQLIVEDSEGYTTYGEDGLPRVVYAHVTKTEYKWDSYVAVTYWMFYFHDPKKAGSELFAHQSDFESVTILINESGPQYIGGSQHFGGERRKWETIEVSNGTHPHLYPSLGSHSVYFTNTEDFEGDIIGQKQHFDEVSDSSVPFAGVWQNPLYYDITGNYTTWTVEGNDWRERHYDLRLLTGAEEWQEYRGSFTKSLTRSVLDKKAQAPKYRTRWKNPGKWMETLVPYEELVQPRVGWGWFHTASSRGTLSESIVTVKPVVWNQKGVLPAQFHVEVIIKDSNGSVLGTNTTVVKREAGHKLAFQRPKAEVAVPLERVPDSVNAEVRVYLEPPAQSESPVASTTAEICDGFLCEL